MNPQPRIVQSALYKAAAGPTSNGRPTEATPTLKPEASGHRPADSDERDDAYRDLIRVLAQTRELNEDRESALRDEIAKLAELTKPLPAQVKFLNVRQDSQNLQIDHVRERVTVIEGPSAAAPSQSSAALVAPKTWKTIAKWIVPLALIVLGAAVIAEYVQIRSLRADLAAQRSAILKIRDYLVEKETPSP